MSKETKRISGKSIVHFKSRCNDKKFSISDFGDTGKCGTINKLRKSQSAIIQSQTKCTKNVRNNEYISGFTSKYKHDVQCARFSTDGKCGGQNTSHILKPDMVKIIDKEIKGGAGIPLNVPINKEISLDITSDEVDSGLERTTSSNRLDDAAEEGMRDTVAEQTLPTNVIGCKLEFTYRFPPFSWLRNRFTKQPTKHQLQETCDRCHRKKRTNTMVTDVTINEEIQCRSIKRKTTNRVEVINNPPGDVNLCEPTSKSYELTNIDSCPTRPYRYNSFIHNRIKSSSATDNYADHYADLLVLENLHNIEKSEQLHILYHKIKYKIFQNLNVLHTIDENSLLVSNFENKFRNDLESSGNSVLLDAINYEDYKPNSNKNSKQNITNTNLEICDDVYSNTVVPTHDTVDENTLFQSANNDISAHQGQVEHNKFARNGDDGDECHSDQIMQPHVRSNTDESLKVMRLSYHDKQQTSGELESDSNCRVADLRGGNPDYSQFIKIYTLICGVHRRLCMLECRIKNHFDDVGIVCCDRRTSRSATIDRVPSDESNLSFKDLDINDDSDDSKCKSKFMEICNEAIDITCCVDPSDKQPNLYEKLCNAISNLLSVNCSCENKGSPEDCECLDQCDES